MRFYKVLFLTFVFSDVASAAIVTVNPANYAVGTNLSHIVDGVSLYGASSLDPSQQYSLLASDCDPCRTPTDGQRVFGIDHIDYGITFSYEESFRKKVVGQYTDYSGPVFLAVFDHPTDFVQVVGQSANVNSWYLDLWSADGTLLGSCVNSGPSAGFCSRTSIGGADPDFSWYQDQWQVGFQSDQQNIAFISVAGWAGPTYVQSLAFNNLAVPLPSAAWLFGSGLLGLFGAISRKPKAFS